MNMHGGQMKEIIEVSHEITKMLALGNITMKKTTEKQDMILEKLLDTEESVAVLVKALSRLEEEASQKLLDSADESKRCASRLCEIEKELHQVYEQNAGLQAEINFITKDLEDLKEMDADTNRMQEEMDEETTEVIPSARYLAQLYHKVTKMDWDYTSEPTLVRGIVRDLDKTIALRIGTSARHKFLMRILETINYPSEITLPEVYYGGDVAQPINLDCTKHSQSYVCDYLWSLLPTEWEPMARTK